MEVSIDQESHRLKSRLYHATKGTSRYKEFVQHQDDISYLQKMFAEIQPNTPRVHDFWERKQFSESAGREPFWQEVYRRAFPSMQFAELVKENTQGQHLGIDRVIYLASGRTIFIDEKIRGEMYDDFLLEYLSNDKTQSQGWMEKELLIDYLSVAFMPMQTVYILDWLTLRRIWLENRAEWMRIAKENEPLTYKERQGKIHFIKANNANYQTHSIIIPKEILLPLMNQPITINLN